MMNRKFKVLLKDTVIFGLGNIGSKIILFFLVPLYTNYLTTEEYGLADLVYTMSQLIYPVVSIVIYEAVIRFGLMTDQKQEEVLKAGIVVGLLGAILTVAATPLLNLYSPVSPWKWYLCIYVILVYTSYIVNSYLKVKNKNKQYALISIAQTFCLALSNIVLLAAFHVGIKGYLISNIIAVSVSVVLSAFSGDALKDFFRARINRKLLLEMVKFSAPLILNTISWWIILSSDKFMIEAMVSESALGIYTVAAKIPALINALIYIFAQAWNLSSIREMDSTNDVAFYSKVFQGYTFLTFGACVTLTAIIKPFMIVYVGKSFHDAWVYVPILLASSVFSSISTYYNELYSALKKSVNSMLTAFLAAGINIIVNYIFILKLGIWGAVIGTIIATAVLAFIRMADVGRAVKIEIDYLHFFANCAIILIQGIMVSLDYHIAMVSIISIMLFALLNYKTLFDVLHAMKGKA